MIQSEKTGCENPLLWLTTSRTHGNDEKSVNDICSIFSLSSGPCQCILTEELKMRQVNGKFAPLGHPGAGSLCVGISRNRPELCELPFQGHHWWWKLVLQLWPRKLVAVISPCKYTENCNEDKCLAWKNKTCARNTMSLGILFHSKAIQPHIGLKSLLWPFSTPCLTCRNPRTFLITHISHPSKIVTSCTNSQAYLHLLRCRQI